MHAQVVLIINSGIGNLTCFSFLNLSLASHNVSQLKAFFSLCMFCLGNWLLSCQVTISELLDVGNSVNDFLQAVHKKSFYLFYYGRGI